MLISTASSLLVVSLSLLMTSCCLAQAKGNGTVTGGGGGGGGNSTEDAFIYFLAPKAKPGGKLDTVRVSSTMEIKWRVEPASAGASGINLYWRSGTWPEVSEYHLIASGLSGTSFNWTLPDNLFATRHIILINSTQKDPVLRTQVSDPFIVYRSKEFFDDGGAGSSNYIPVTFYCTLGLFSSLAVMVF